MGDPLPEILRRGNAQYPGIGRKFSQNKEYSTSRRLNRLGQFAGKDHRFRNFPHRAPGAHALLLETLVGFLFVQISLPLEDALRSLYQFPSLKRLLAFLDSDR